MSETEQHIVNQPVTEEAQGSIPRDQEVTQVIPSERHQIPRRLGVARRFALSGLAAVTWLTGGSVINSGPIRPSDEPLILDNYIGLVTEPILGPTLIPQSTLQPKSIKENIGDQRTTIGTIITATDNIADAESAENEASNLIAEIKRKYNVELITKAKAAEFLNRGEILTEGSPDGKPREAKWTLTQVRFMHKLLEFVPKPLLRSVKGVNIKIFPIDSDMHTACECRGLTYWDTGVIALGQELFENTRDEGLPYFVLVHELIHRKDFLTGNEINDRIREIIVDPVKLREKLSTGVNLSSISEDEYLANKALSQFDSKLVEGVAEMGRLYNRGYVRFMNSVEPILGEKKENLKVEQLKDAYPEAQRLYDAFKYTLFDGEDSEVPEAIKLLADPKVDPQEARINLETSYPIQFVGGEVNNTIQIQNLGIALKNLPEQFYAPTREGEGQAEVNLKISFGDSTKLISKNELQISNEHITERQILPAIAGALSQRTDSYNSVKEQIKSMYGKEISEEELGKLVIESIENYVFSAGDPSYWFMNQASYFLNYLNESAPEDMKSEVLYDYIGKTLFNDNHFEYITDIGGNITLSMQPN